MEKMKKISQNIISAKRHVVGERIRMDLAILMVFVIGIRLLSGAETVVKESYYENSKSTGVHRSMPAAFGRGISNVHIREELNCRSVKRCLESRSVVPVNWTKSIAERKQPTKEKTSYKIMGEDSKDAMVNADTSSGNVKEKKMAAGSGNSGTTYIEETTEVIAPDTSGIAGTDTSAGNLEEENVLEDLLILDGFAINSEGLIEYCTDLELVLDDGMLVLPSDARCTGIGSGALEKITQAVEVYIPANIVSIAPGALEHIAGLMYIEVAPDNPVYESRDGVLYTKTGEMVSYPSGR